MTTATNPYQTPPEAHHSDFQNDPFSSWNTWKMVALFFLPSLALIIAFTGLTFMIPVLTIGGAIGTSCGALTVIIFSALVHQRRQHAGWGTFLLMALVYLIAQTFAIFLTIAAISITSTNLGLRIP